MERDPDSRSVVIPPVHGNMCCTCVPLRSLHNQGRGRKPGRVLVLLSAPAAPQGAAGVSTRAGSDPLASARSDLQTLLWSDNGSDSEYLKNGCQIPAKQDWRKGRQRGTRRRSRPRRGRVGQQEVDLTDTEFYFHFFPTAFICREVLFVRAVTKFRPRRLKCARRQRPGQIG